MKEYGMRKFIPGQVISAAINTAELDGSITKKRPYLIVASNNRRLILLRMTHGGNYSSNWLYSTYDNGEDEEDDSDTNDNDILEPVDSDNKTIEAEKDTDATESSGKIIEVTHKLGSVRPGEEANKLGKKSGYSRKGSHYRKLEPERDYILATDCFIYNKGWTKSDMISIQLAKLGIKNSKFIMDDLKNRNKVVYMNNSYNVTLKSGLIVNKSRTTSNAKEYAREIIADCEKVGFERAGLIWGRGTEFMRTNYWKFKEELSNSKVDENVG